MPKAAWRCTGFVEPHIHLDKALISERAPVNVSGTLTEAIEILWEIKRNYTVEEIADRASRVLTRAIENGISRLRTHVDVDPIGGTRPAEGLIRARDRFRDLIDIQIVAFPQEGIVKSPGTEALMRQVMELGVDVVGGMPFNEASPQDSRRHIEIVFDIARAFDADIDMHVDETDDPAREPWKSGGTDHRHGWQGRVTAGHTCALAGYPRDYADHVIARLREANINMIANPATNLMLQGRLDDYPKRRGVTQVKELLGRRRQCRLWPGLRARHVLSVRPERSAGDRVSALPRLAYEPARRNSHRDGYGHRQWREGLAGRRTSASRSAASRIWSCSMPAMRARRSPPGPRGAG